MEAWPTPDVPLMQAMDTFRRVASQWNRLYFDHIFQQKERCNARLARIRRLRSAVDVRLGQDTRFGGGLLAAEGKGKMPKLTGEQQAIDNIVIAQEMIHLLERKTERKGDMVIKVDLEKAYDRIYKQSRHGSLGRGGSAAIAL